MIEKLFSSAVAYAVLRELATRREPTTAAELVRATGKDQANVSRELKRLEGWGFIVRHGRARSATYALDDASTYARPLRELLAIAADAPQLLLVNEEAGTALLSLDFFLRGMTSDRLLQPGLLREKPLPIMRFKNDYMWVYFDEAAWRREAERTTAQLLRDPSVVEHLVTPQTRAAGATVLEAARALSAADYRVPAEEAAAAIEQFADAVETQMAVNFLAVFDLVDQPLTSALTQYLAPRAGRAGISTGQAAEQLLAPSRRTLTQEMRAAVLARALRRPAPGEAERLASDWGWLNYGYRGPGITAAFFAQTLEELRRAGPVAIRREAGALERYERRTRAVKARLFRTMRVDPQHQAFIAALSTLAELKVYRKDIAFLAIATTHRLLAAADARYTLDERLYLRVREACALLRGEETPPPAELQRRRRECVIVGTELRYVGDAAATFSAARLEGDARAPSQQALRLLSGMTACLGPRGESITARVRIINHPDDVAKMQPGDILVSYGTTPDLLPAMKVASAIVTDQGGITCHAAIVSRELNIPCLIGTSYATKVFKDGDLVTVCPRHCYIKFADEPAHPR